YASIKTPEPVMMQMAAMQYPGEIYPQMLRMLWPFCVFPFALAAVSSVCAGFVFALLRQHSQTGAIPRSAKWLNWDGHAIWRTVKGSIFMTVVLALMLVILLVPAVLCIIYIGMREGIVCLGLLTLLWLLLALPAEYGWFRYIMEDGHGYWKHLWSDYATAMRYYGTVFIVTVICLIGIAVAWFITYIPSGILGAANMQAHLGVVLYGDNLGMPGYIVPLTYAVFAAASFCQLFIHITLLFPLYYMYGSIKAKEEGRKKQTWLDRQ
ncbi:MAG: hypothetical protein IJ253_03130, partial [Bacteroidaceae bacterium]|nr:hypothetical protein [Bacteroidaceae bacterium]